ncbi:MAG: hypothetical protein R3E39_10965 [Anaerolineae bacterium]
MMTTVTFMVQRAAFRRRGPPWLLLLTLFLLGAFIFGAPSRATANIFLSTTPQLILTWSIDGTARVWDAATGTEQLTFKHDAAVRGARWNSDGTRILTWSDDNTARVWDATSGDEYFILKHESGVLGAAWNTDNSQILTWAADGTVHVWDASSGEKRFSPVAEPSPGTYRVGAMWNADESKILSWVWWFPSSGGNPSGTVHVWDVAAGKEIWMLPPKMRFGAVWNAAGNHILVLDIPTVLDAASGEELLTAKKLRGWLYGAGWNKDESRISYWMDNGTIHVINASSGTEELKLRHGQAGSEVYGVVWNNAATELMSWSDDDTTRVWDSNTGEERLTLEHDALVNGASWNSAESRILSWSDDGTARVWDAVTGQQSFVLQHDDSVIDAAWNTDESLILTCSTDNTARVWDAATGQQLSILRHEGFVNGAIWSPR